MLEDLAACTGVLIAIAGIAATHFTGITQFDGIASLCIGGLLGLISSTLVSINRRFLIGQAIEPSIEADIKSILEHRPSIEAVYDLQSQWIGPSAFTIKAEVDFRGEFFANKLRKMGYEELFLTYGQKRENLTLLLSWYTEDVTRLVEHEILSIEREIKAKYSEAAYIEIEPSSKLDFFRIDQDFSSSARVSPAVAPAAVVQDENKIVKQ